MRTALTCLAWLSAAGVALPQSTPYLATVTADNVSVRSGPGFTMEETGSLAQNESVVVLNDEGAQWLAIEPPRGQVSWVRTGMLEEVPGGDRKVVPRNAVVRADHDADIAMGRAGLAAPLSVRKDKVPDGTIVLVIGPNYLDTSVGTTSWTPIQPVKGERRYLPRSAVRVTSGQATVGYSVQPPPVPRLPAPGGTGANPVEGVRPAVGTRPGDAPTAQGKPDGWPNDPTWLKAEEASRNQEYDRAERLYLQLASDQNQPGGDVELANLCYARVHSVLEKRQAAGRPARPVATPVSRGESDNASRPAAKSREPQWISAGTIRETGFDRGVGPKYSFRSASTGKVVAYLEAGPNVDLGDWLQAEVELYAAERPALDSGGSRTLTVTRVRRAGSRRD